METPRAEEEVEEVVAKEAEGAAAAAVAAAAADAADPEELDHAVDELLEYLEADAARGWAAVEISEDDADGVLEEEEMEEPHPRRCPLR